MPNPLQFEAPTALQYFASLVADDASLSVVEAAASIAQDEFPQLDIQAVLAEVDALANTLKRRFPADASSTQKLRGLNQYFFQELGFAGNVNNYYDRQNSYLHSVLNTRRGIPITLALIYIELASQIGLTARGVSFPGHFLIKLRLQTGTQQGEVVLDPFTGHSLSHAQLDEQLEPYKRQMGLMDEFDTPLDLFLQAATSREVVARMLRNLKEIHRSARDVLRLLQVLHRLVVLLPHDMDERRDRGLVQADLGLDAAAVLDLTLYLKQSGNVPDRAMVSSRLAALNRGAPGA
jgi:regulator of sirC expression with transglutaminase-like and TPR domain